MDVSVYTKLEAHETFFTKQSLQLNLLDTRAICYWFEDWKNGSRKQLFKYLPLVYFTKEVNSSLDKSPLINDFCLVKRAPTFSVNQAIDSYLNSWFLDPYIQYSVSWDSDWRTFC